jgi:hypothetical protein
MSIATVITGGFGSFGSAAFVVTAGFGAYSAPDIGELIADIFVYPAVDLGEPAISTYAATGLDFAASYPALAATLAVKG